MPIHECWLLCVAPIDFNAARKPLMYVTGLVGLMVLSLLLKITGYSRVSRYHRGKGVIRSLATASRKTYPHPNCLHENYSHFIASDSVTLRKTVKKEGLQPTTAYARKSRRVVRKLTPYSYTWHFRSPFLPANGSHIRSISRT